MILLLLPRRSRCYAPDLAISKPLLGQKSSFPAGKPGKRVDKGPKKRCCRVQLSLIRKNKRAMPSQGNIVKLALEFEFRSKLEYYVRGEQTGPRSGWGVKR
jgi:hypothetical protein